MEKVKNISQSLFEIYQMILEILSNIFEETGYFLGYAYVIYNAIGEQNNFLRVFERFSWFGMVRNDSRFNMNLNGIEYSDV